MSKDSKYYNWIHKFVLSDTICCYDRKFKQERNNSVEKRLRSVESEASVVLLAWTNALHSSVCLLLLFDHHFYPASSCHPGKCIYTYLQFTPNVLTLKSLPLWQWVAVDAFTTKKLASANITRFFTSALITTGHKYHIVSQSDVQPKERKHW